MAQGRSTKIISMIKWIRTSRLSIKNSLSVSPEWGSYLVAMVHAVRLAPVFGFRDFLRLIDSCITQLKAQGPSRARDESKEEEEEGFGISSPRKLFEQGFCTTTS